VDRSVVGTDGRAAAEEDAGPISQPIPQEPEMSYQSLTTGAAADHRRQQAEAHSVHARTVRLARAAAGAQPADASHHDPIATAIRLLRRLPSRPGTMARPATAAR
jgi:hypothetical protein